MRNNQVRLRLLPNYFKKIGLGILVITVLFFLLWRYKILTIDKTLVLTISKAGIIVSLMILSWTKTKMEDELIVKLRLIAFAISFGLGGFLIISGSFMELLGLDNKILNVLYNNATFIVVSMYISYFSSFYQMLKNR